MGGMSFDVSAVRELAATIAGSPGRVGAKGSQILRKTAIDVEADAKLLVPPRIDTGDMQESITAEFRGDGRNAVMEADIGPTVDYAIWQHDGTSTIAPHPFMWQALDRREPGFIQAVQMLGEEIL